MTTAASEAELEEGRMSLIEHLTELRTRLIKSAVAIGVGGVVAWIFYPQIVEFLIEPYSGICDNTVPGDTPGANPECQLLVTDPLEPFTVRLTVAGYGGLALAMPFLLWQLWRFVSPGLYARERRYGLIFVFAGFALFVLGAGLAYWSLPRALSFLDTIGGENLVSFFSPDRYLKFVVKMMAAFGLGFQFPIVLIFLQLAGLVDNKTLRAGRQYAAVGIVVLTAVITPSGDPFTLLVLTVPMYVFYEFAILFGRLRDRRHRRAAASS
ncbi:MAG: twin-arginine translocase subunit TatC [Acidimicrobiia bacterium]|nr:twin-arginine translocase subunit TatC [Acidimicrobiia bacterium]